jgi:hypothetical protein
MSCNKKDIVLKYKEKLIKIDKLRRCGYTVCEEECNLIIYKTTEKINEAIIKVGINNELTLLLIEETSAEIKAKIKSHEHHINYIKVKNTDMVTKKINAENYKYFSIEKEIDKKSIIVKNSITPDLILNSKLKMDFYKKLKHIFFIDNANDYFYDNQERSINEAVASNSDIKFGSGYMIIKNNNGENIIPFKSINNISTLENENSLISKKDENLNFNIINTINLTIFINNKEIVITVFPKLYNKIREKFIAKIKYF